MVLSVSSRSIPVKPFNVRLNQIVSHPHQWAERLKIVMKQHITKVFRMMKYVRLWTIMKENRLPNNLRLSDSTNTQFAQMLAMSDSLNGGRSGRRAVFTCPDSSLPFKSRLLLRRTFTLPTYVTIVIRHSPRLTGIRL